MSKYHQSGLFDEPLPAHCRHREPKSNPTVDPADEPRLSGARLAILEHLRARGKATNVELTAVGGMRFGARIEELNKAGYVIKSRRAGGSVWEYQLVEEHP